MGGLNGREPLTICKLLIVFKIVAFQLSQMAMCFLHFVESALWDHGLISLPPNRCCPKFQNCGSEVIGLRLVETDTLHCLGYLLALSS